MSGLDDGNYEVVVVEADQREDGSIVLALVVSTGPHRGDVVTLSATGLGRSWIELLAAPGTLSVTAGQPSLRLD